MCAMPLKLIQYGHLHLYMCVCVLMSVSTRFFFCQFDLVVYNSLARNWSGILRVPINTTLVTVTGPTGTFIPTQVQYLSNSSYTHVAMHTHGNLLLFSYLCVYLLFGYQIIPVSHTTMRVRRDKGTAAYELLFGVFGEVSHHHIRFQRNSD